MTPGGLDLPALAARRRVGDHSRWATRSRAAPPAGSRRSPSSSPSAARSPRSSACSAASEEERETLTTAWTWLSTGNFEVGLTLLVDPLAATMMLIVSGVGGLIVLYSVGYMDGDDGGAALLRLHVVLRLLDAPARPGGELPDPARRLGARRPRLVPADRLLARAPGGGRRSQEGVHHERVRRRDDGARLLRPDLDDRDARVRRGLRGRRGDVLDRASTSSRWGCSAARWRSRRRSRSTPGSRTRWRARRPSPR